MKAEDSKYAWYPGDNWIAAVISLGNAIDEEINHAFLEGRYADAVKLDEEGVKNLFECEKQVRSEIDTWCQENGLIIVKRLSEPDDLPVERLKEMVSQAQTYKDIGVRVNESGVIIPGKSLCFVYVLGKEEKKIDAVKACITCERMDCPYRDSE